MRRLFLLTIFLVLGVAAARAQPTLEMNRLADAQPRNVIFILSDDHRFDFMGFTGKVPWLRTPHMDRLAREGAYFPNAFVTTSLCSPSRASILTGQFSHTHTVIDNQAPAPDDLIYFPQYLQQAGYQTGFFGKWHMGGDTDEPRPGFTHWESFRGQGVYYNPTLNINGKRQTYGDSTYITDLLTEHAVDWLKNRNEDQPFFLYLSHKAVHAEFQPAARHLGTYENEEINLPPSFFTSAQPVKGKTNAYGLPSYAGTTNTVEDTVGYPPGFLAKRRQQATDFEEPARHQNYYGPNMTPDWQKSQRESWHGVDYMYHGDFDYETFYRRYCETLLGVDESIGAVLDYLDEAGLADSTLVIYMGDNGFAFGEHGLIDKRQFYEESVKVPFLVRYPEVLEGGQVIEKMVQNIDVAPTVLEVAGINQPEQMQGRSMVPILKDEVTDWRDRIFYEYYWEYAFPQTPTMHGVRTDRYKYIRYHGVWDSNEFYDLQEDPYEMHNLIASPEHQDTIRAMLDELYGWMETTGGMQIPLKRTMQEHVDHRNRGLY